MSNINDFTLTYPLGHGVDTTAATYRNCFKTSRDFPQ